MSQSLSSSSLSLDSDSSRPIDSSLLLGVQLGQAVHLSLVDLVTISGSDCFFFMAVLCKKDLMSVVALLPFRNHPMAQVSEMDHSSAQIKITDQCSRLTCHNLAGQPGLRSCALSLCPPPASRQRCACPARLRTCPRPPASCHHRPPARVQGSSIPVGRGFGGGKEGKGMSRWADGDLGEWAVGDSDLCHLWAFGREENWASLLNKTR